MPIGRRFSTIFAALLAALAAGALSAGVLSASAWAQVPAGNAYTVEGVDVDATGADPIKARDQGIKRS